MKTLFVIMLTCFSVYAQFKKIDSLETQLQNLKGAEKIESLLNLSKLYRSIDSKKVIEFGEQAAVMSKEIKDTVNYINALNNIGVGYDILGKYDTALNYYFRSIKLCKKTKNKKGEAFSLNGIGIVYVNLKNYEKALEYYFNALEINKDINYRRGISVVLNNIGEVLEFQGKYKDALEYHENALKIKTPLGDKKSIAHSLHNLGKVNALLENPNKAIEYHRKSLAMREEIGDKQGVAISLTEIGRINLNIRNYTRAESHLLKALDIFENMSDKRLVVNTLGFLAELYEKTGNHKNSLKYFKMYSEKKDSLFQLENAGKIAEMQAKYEIALKESENEKLKRKNAIIETEIAGQKIMIISTAIGLILTGLLAFVFYNGRQKEKSINEILTEKNERIQEQKNELDRLNSAKDKFFSIMAHDLRNPFHTISSSTEMLIKDYDELDNKDIKDILQILYAGSTKGYELVENLLMWARSQNFEIQYSPEKIILCELAKDNCDLIKDVAKSKKINLEINCKKDLTVLADKNMVNTVLRNLITNAFKFSTTGGNVTINATNYNNDKILISIADTGIGISEDDIKKLFKIDSKFSTPGTEGERGSGLGLILCKEFIEKNGGEIWVESEPGKGSNFKFTLPCV